MLLLYTIDTTFTTEDFASPLTVVSLGLFPTKDVRVRTTASAVLLGTHNGYVYGLAEATAERSGLANAWTDDHAVDDTRRKTETEAFDKLVSDFEIFWGRVVAQYATGK